MVKLDYFEIILSRERLIFFPGEEVSGNLIIKAKERLKISSVLLEFKGKAYVHWTTGSGKDESSHTDRDTFFEVKKFILQKQANKKHLYLDNIEYKFPFCFNLPPTNLPTSIEFLQGYIRYFVKASIDIPWSSSEHALKCFTVINPLDLNILPGLRQPCGVNDIKTVCCGPCKSDPIIIDLKTNKTGFVPGETIVFNALIDNRSSNTIKSVTALLIQNTKLIAGRLTTSCSNNIVTLIYTGPKIGPGMKGNLSNVRLKIPPLCPSLLETCRIIKLHYSLTLVIDVSTFSEEKVLSLPIVIGSVPLNDSNIYLSSVETNEYCRSIIDRHEKLGNDRHDLDKKEREACGNYKYRFKFESSYFEPRYPYYKDFALGKFSFCD